MNSAQLQKQFPEFYRDFFSKNDLVVSGCFSFPWGSIIGGRSNNILTKSKIPMKTFIGIKKIKKSVITHGEINVFDIVKKTFCPHSLVSLEIEVSSIDTIIQEFLKQNNYTGGIEIAGLSEISRGHSFGFAGTFFATLATGLFILLEKVAIKDIVNDYEKFTQSDIFNEIFALGRKMEKIAKYGNTIGQNVMHTLQNTPNPSYFFGEKYQGDDAVKAPYFQFMDIVKKNDDQVISSTIPLDYVVVFSGVPSSTKMIEATNKVRGSSPGNYGNFIHKTILGEEAIKKNIYIRKFTENETLISQTYDDVITLSGVKTIDLFSQMFTSGYNEDIIDNFLGNINQNRHAISFIEKLNDFADDFIFHFRKNKKHSDEKFSILPIYYSGKMGGGYLIAMKSWISRDSLESTMKEMRNTYPNIEIEYSSYMDGLCSNGIILDQFVSKGVFSPYVQADKVLFKNNNGESYLEKYNIILEKEVNGLVIDTITNKIYLNGIKLTSKEIPSQNTTAEILSILFERMGEDISNKELPSSSYSSNKNEMLGKIVIPLVKLLEEHLDKTFPFICKGEIADFYLKLNATTIPVGIVRKL